MKPKKQNPAGIEIPTAAIAGVGLTNWSNPSDESDNEADSKSKRNEIFRPLAAIR